MTEPVISTPAGTPTEVRSRTLLQRLADRAGFIRRARQMPWHSWRMDLIMSLPDTALRRLRLSLPWTKVERMEPDIACFRWPTGDVTCVPAEQHFPSLMARWVYCDCAYLDGYDARHALEPGQIVIDAGSCVGAFALLAARLVGPAGRVLAVEPIRRNCDAISASARAGGVEQSIQVVCTALGEDVGEIVLIRSAEDFTTASAVRKRKGDPETVRLTTIDELCREASLPRLDFIKMDVEGMEAEVLKGAREAVRRFRPTLSIACYHKPDDVETLTALIRDLRAGYRIDHRGVLGVEPNLYATAR